MCNAPIGIFDSGVGGLTVLRALRDRLPAEDLLYVGDTARVPYGTRGPDTIRRYSENVAAHLVAHGCKLIVIACNTASAWAIDHLRATFPVPVIDVIEPIAARIAAVSEPAPRVLVLATRATVRSRAYPRALLARQPQLAVVQQACPLLVPLAEEGLIGGPIVEAVLHHYLDPLELPGVSDVVLGCTHYPLLRTAIEAVVRERAPNARMWDSAGACAEAVATTLAARELAAEARVGSTRIQVTDDPETVGALAALFLGGDPGPLEHVDIGTAPAH